MLVNCFKEKKRYNVNLAGLLLVKACFSIMSLFVNIFLLAQIFIITEESFVALGLFSIFNFTFIFLFQMIGGILCKQVSSSFVMRASSLLTCLLLLVTFFFYDQIDNYYMFLGLIWGCINGLYYSAYQFLISKNSKDESTLSYISLSISISAILGLIFPFTFGAFIHYGSFLITIVIILIIGIIQMLATLFIQGDKEESNKLEIKRYFKAIKEAKHVEATIKLWFIMFLTGFANTIGVMTTALVMLTFNTHLDLGILTSIFAAMTALLSYVYKKAEKHRKFFYGAAVFLPIISVIYLLGTISLFSVTTFTGIYSTTRIFIFMEEETIRLGATNYWKGGDAFVMESNLFYETALASGSIISALLVMLVGAFYIQWLVIFLLFIVVLAFSLHGILLKRWKYVNSIK